MSLTQDEPRKKPGRGNHQIKARLRRENDGKPCPYCSHQMRIGSRKSPTVDRVIPGSIGGRYLQENLLVVCFPCNQDKDDFTLEEWLRRLRIGGDLRAGRIAALIEERRS